MHEFACYNIYMHDSFWTNQLTYLTIHNAQRDAKENKDI